MIFILFQHMHHYIIFQILIFHFLIDSFYFHVIISINPHHYRLLIKFPQNNLLMIIINQPIIFKPLYQQSSTFH